MNSTSNFEQYWDDFIQLHPSLKGKRYYEAFAFGSTENLANNLVVSCVKTATSSLLWSIEQESKPAIQVGDYRIVINWQRSHNVLLRPQS